MADTIPLSVVGCTGIGCVKMHSCIRNFFFQSRYSEVNFHGTVLNLLIFFFFFLQMIELYCMILKTAITHENKVKMKHVM